MSDGVGGVLGCFFLAVLSKRSGSPGFMASGV